MLCLDVEGVVFLGVAVGGEGDIGGYAFVCGMCCGVVEGSGVLWGWWTLGLRWCWVGVGVVRRQGWESAMLCTGWGCGEGEEMLCLDVEGVVFLGVAVGGEGDVSG